LEKRWWGIVAGAALAAGVLAVILTAARQRTLEEALADVPAMIEDCADKIAALETDLLRLHPALTATA
jgi:hypothetical protein